MVENGLKGLKMHFKYNFKKSVENDPVLNELTTALYAALAGLMGLW